MENTVDSLELSLVLEAIAGLSGYHFFHYSPVFLQRRLTSVATTYNRTQISELIPLMLRNHRVMEEVLRSLSINTSAFFREPKQYALLRRIVLPQLHSYPFITLWSAGCSSGEEAYSLAILLAEEGLLERSRIYATDFNQQALEQARQGRYAIKHLEQARNNHLLSGGKNLESFLESERDTFILSQTLRQHIVFAHHNLVQDRAFAEINLIQCSNVLIYFDTTLKQHCLQLFHDSLCNGGYLSLGSCESLDGHNPSPLQSTDIKSLYRKTALPICNQR